MNNFKAISTRSTAARGGGTQGAEPGWLRGPEVLGPLRGLGSRHLVSAIRGLGKRLQGPRRGVSVRFQWSGKTRWATQRPLRGPVFPEGSNFQPSGSYPRATDNKVVPKQPLGEDPGPLVGDAYLPEKGRRLK